MIYDETSVITNEPVQGLHIDAGGKRRYWTGKVRVACSVNGRCTCTLVECDDKWIAMLSGNNGVTNYNIYKELKGRPSLGELECIYAIVPDVIPNMRRQLGYRADVISLHAAKAHVISGA